MESAVFHMQVILIMFYDMFSIIYLAIMVLSI